MRNYLFISRQLIKTINQQQSNHHKLINNYYLFSSFNKRYLSTSKLRFADDPFAPIDPKKYGSPTYNYLDPAFRLRPPPPKSVEDFANPDKTGYWLNLGFDEVDREADKYWANLCFFFCGSVFFGILFFYFYYEPDHIRMKEWICREAYLELHRREKHGLPLVDPDYVPLDRMILPPEEEIKVEVHY